jgi:hypothetical protein
VQAGNVTEQDSRLNVEVPRRNPNIQFVFGMPLTRYAPRVIDERQNQWMARRARMMLRRQLLDMTPEDEVSQADQIRG